jgi:hypothetical protein
VINQTVVRMVHRAVAERGRVGSVHWMWSSVPKGPSPAAVHDLLVQRLGLAAWSRSLVWRLGLWSHGLVQEL